MKAFLLLLFVVSVYGADINVLVNQAYQNNPTLKKIELQIKNSEYDIKNSGLYKNPVLTFGVNDINLDEPSKRDLEAMQATYISIAQEITDSDKLEYKTKIAHINKEILQIILQEKKDLIVKNIYNLAYIINELEKKIELNNQKLLNIKQIKNYHNNNIENTKAFQETLQNDLMIDTINLQIQVDTQAIEQSYAKLSEIVNQDIKSVEGSVSFIYDKNLEAHKLLQVEELNIKKAALKKQLARENESSDYTISAGYFQRKSFDDYVNIAIKFPLNIYDKEENELHKAYKEQDISKQKYDEVKNTLVKRQKIELSKNKLAKNSIKYLDMIISHLEKEKTLVLNQSNKDSIISILKIENKIIENKIKKLSFKKQYELSRLELAYLSSTLTKG